MEKVKAEIKKITIDTYLEPEPEELPLFSENRVHQRTSGRPYPNKVVVKVNREKAVPHEYTAVMLENEYIKLCILPEIGGRIYSAYDKKHEYDFFYKQHVIKPALIGALGSWISGGVEFNWPYHHRASGFMPCDFKLEYMSDGSAVCWLSEHDPTDRMKGMVGIILRPQSGYIETKVRLFNRTPASHSFLWWENAAVPVNENYQIFFPEDVSYVNFHYLKSRTTYPIAGSGVYNGIPMDEPRDISWHKNTKEATSYFSGITDYDFFGGYDHGKQCGVVHVADHHISPGKKLFTWGYGQLSQSWERALTDNDGQYAELMAGSYSDNQPDFSFIEAYETKEFSQYWYPISQLGIPMFANLNCAFSVKWSGCQSLFKIQSTKPFNDVKIIIKDESGKIIFSECRSLSPCKCEEFFCKALPTYLSVEIWAGQELIAEYTKKKFDKYDMPEPITDMPAAAGMNSADELYLAGLHVEQYRDPSVYPDSYWKEALKRDINHIPSLTAMAGYELSRYNLSLAEDYAERAVKRATIFNSRVKSGEIYYTYARILETSGKLKKAYDYYQKAALASDCVGRAMTRISFIDLKSKNFKDAVRHAETALNYGRNNSSATAALIFALILLENNKRAETLIEKSLMNDPLDHLIRLTRYSKKQNDNTVFIAPEFYELMSSNPAETCLDLASDLYDMGLYENARALLNGLIKNRSDSVTAMIYYSLGFFEKLCGTDGNSSYKKAEKSIIGTTFPHRYIEMVILQDVLKYYDDKTACYLLGCLYFSKRNYNTAASLFEKDMNNYMSLRNLAVTYYSHLDREKEALSLMQKALSLRPGSEQLLFETVVLMDRLGAEPIGKINLITSFAATRDDVFTELAKAYNQAGRPGMAIKTLKSRNFVPCEGGEHEIADQCMTAYFKIGRKMLAQNNVQAALNMFRAGQILPDNLGAGIWNHCKLVPNKYYEAVCLEKLGNKAMADMIFEYIAKIEVEYFSNMYLKELPYYKIKSLFHLGKQTDAQRLITKYRREWDKIAQIRDNGYFNTTPFFISFITKAKKLRSAQHLYLSALINDCMGETEEALKKVKDSVELNNDNLFALEFAKNGFPE